MLGNDEMVFSGAVNGRLAEAQVLAAYINQAHRLNWAIAGSQQPLYFYLPTTVQSSTSGNYILTPQIERFVIRDAFAQGVYPFNRFTRVELGLHLASISQAVLKQDYFFSSGQLVGINDPVDSAWPTISDYGPQIALVHDNALFGYVGPFAGARSRLEISPNLGSWRFTAATVDWRRYLL